MRRLALALVSIALAGAASLACSSCKSSSSGAAADAGPPSSLGMNCCFFGIQKWWAGCHKRWPCPTLRRAAALLVPLAHAVDEGQDFGTLFLEDAEEGEDSDAEGE